MSTFSGRRPTDRMSRSGKGFLEGLTIVGTVLADGPKHERINEIDAEMERLQLEKDTLIASLIEPGNLKVSEGYDPNKAVVNKPPHRTADGGRLTQCAGQWSATTKYHDAHPGCPYLGTKHNPHEFTLRD